MSDRSTPPISKDELVVWLRQALEGAKLTQSELARRLTQSLGRSVERGAVHSMLAGERHLRADELLEVARICRFKLPAVRGCVRTRSSPTDKPARQPRLPGLDSAEQRAS